MKFVDLFCRQKNERGVALVPFIETSDPEKLCKCPLVSVHMITYNHEPYIRQAIESVVMQKADFEYELVIGEDASQDRTRTICFECQKKYPDKIRVLWWHENVNRKGGNANRVRQHCRGRYIAYCEGDDYWTDENKLQKQIELIRRSNAVGCVAINDIRKLDGTVVRNDFPTQDFIDDEAAFRHYFHTSTYVFDADVCSKMMREHPQVTTWYDIVLLQCMVEVGKICFLPDVVSVYRQSGEGIFTSLSNVERCLLLVRQYLILFNFGPRKFHRRYGLSVLSQLRNVAVSIVDEDSRASYLRNRRYIWMTLLKVWMRLGCSWMATKLVIHFILDDKLKNGCICRD